MGGSAHQVAVHCQRRQRAILGQARTVPRVRQLNGNVTHHAMRGLQPQAVTPGQLAHRPTARAVGAGSRFWTNCNLQQRCRRAYPAFYLKEVIL